MQYRWQTTVAIAALISLPACASLQESRCSAHEQRVVADTLYFGTAKPNGAVSEAEWSRFLQAEVTARFPLGLTVYAATGQWRGANGAAVREATHVLQIVHLDSAANDTLVNEVITAYKSEFQQESVLRVKTDACVSY